MKVSLKWLSQYVDLSDKTPQELAHRLTMSGLEVSGLEDLKADYNNVVVAKLLSISPHPNADKLQLTEVEIPGETVKVVCGAKNIAVGDVVPFAQVGAILPGDFEIKKAKIRGEESFGMLCSEKELALADDAAGIMQLPKDTPPGTPIAGLIGKDDVLIEVEITPNRSDCLSHMGIARHLAAVLDRPFSLPPVELNETGAAVQTAVQIAIEKDCGCNRYCARVIDGVKVGPSPAWLKQFIENAGMRSVNNIVDATNYILLDIGHPLHAFDKNKLKGNLITARQAKAKESITTIDGDKRSLQGNELVIADQSGPVALAGVMGGLDTEVSDSTTTILLESAWFNASLVRQCSNQTNCHSESSYRFERGVDPESGLLLALDKCAGLIVECAGGSIFKGFADDYPLPLKKRATTITLAKIEKVLGIPIEEELALPALKRLGYNVTTQEDSVFNVTIPSYRHDVSIAEDLTEDIAQVIGYDKIPTKTPLVPMISTPPDKWQVFLKKCRTLAMESGLNEIVTYSFMDPKKLDHLRLPEEHVFRKSLTIKNPISEATSHMRTTLLPGLIDTLIHNQRRGQDRICLFETGSVFLPQPDQELPDEPGRLGIIATGTATPMNWKHGKKQPDFDFYHLKGKLDTIFRKLNIKAVRYEADGRPYLHPMISFKILSSDKKLIGWAGALHPETQEHYKIKTTVFAAELNLDFLEQRWVQKPTVKAFSKFPTMKRDIALAVEDVVQSGSVIKEIQSIGKNLLVSILPFDVYKGKGLEPGTKSLAFSLTFQHLERTLQEEEVNTIQSDIMKHLEKKFGARQR